MWWPPGDIQTEPEIPRDPGRQSPGLRRACSNSIGQGGGGSEADWPPYSQLEGPKTEILSPPGERGNVHDAKHGAILVWDDAAEGM